MLYRILFVIISGICVGIHFNFNDEFYNAHSFSFFTVWSNIFCLVIMCIFIIKDIYNQNCNKPSLIYFKGMALSAILCAFLVYHFGECRTKYPLLEIGIFGLPLTTLLSHYIVPFLFVMDWLLFQPKGQFKWWHIGGWLLFPLIYFIGFICRIFCNSRESFLQVEKYPYFFLDFETLGIWNFLSYVLLILVIITAENVLLVIIDRILYRYKTQQDTH